MIDKLEKTIKKHLKSEFQKELLKVSVHNLEQNNKLRFNNFAYSIRELVRHFLKDLAPDNEIQSCLWFKNDTKEKINSLDEKGSNMQYKRG